MTTKTKKLTAILATAIFAVFTASAEEVSTTNEMDEYSKALEQSNNDMVEYYKARVKYHEEECKSWMEYNQARAEYEKRMLEYDKNHEKGVEDLATIA